MRPDSTSTGSGDRPTPGAGTLQCVAAALIVVAGAALSGQAQNFNLDFNGEGDYVGGFASDFSFIQNTGVFTIELWMRLDEPDADDAYPIFGSTPASAERGFVFMFENRSLFSGDRALRLAMTKGISGLPITDSRSPADIIIDTGWHHVAVVGAAFGTVGDDVTFYVDGVAHQGSQDMGGLSIGASSRSTRIGSGHFEDFGVDIFFDGQIDELRVWDVTRTALEIKANRFSHLTGSEPGLVAYWKFNEGSGQTVADETANSEDGQLGFSAVADTLDPTWTTGEVLLPVELGSFEAIAAENSVELMWTTASETDNAGFDIERTHAENGSWQMVDFVPGAGTSATARVYRYRVDGLTPGNHRFRLIQRDFDGTLAISPEVETYIAWLSNHVLSDPHPNPFATQTSFSVAVPETQHVRVDVVDALGRLVTRLADDTFPADTPREFRFDSSELPNGLYLIDVSGDRFNDVRTVVLAR